ncbi:unnamed protein product, partial [Phaeothamnion confervicola]
MLSTCLEALDTSERELARYRRREQIGEDLFSSALGLTMTMLKGEVVQLTARQIDGLAQLARLCGQSPGQCAARFKAAHIAIKAVVVEMAGEQRAGERWVVPPDAFEALPPHCKNQLLKALRLLVVSFDLMAEADKASLGTSGEIIKNREHLIDFAERCVVFERDNLVAHGNPRGSPGSGGSGGISIASGGAGSSGTASMGGSVAASAGGASGGGGGGGNRARRTSADHSPAVPVPVQPFRRWSMATALPEATPKGPMRTASAGPALASVHETSGGSGAGGGGGGRSRRPSAATAAAAALVGNGFWAEPLGALISPCKPPCSDGGGTEPALISERVHSDKALPGGTGMAAASGLSSAARQLL